MADATTLAENGNHKSPNRRDILLVSIPRTASNLCTSTRSISFLFFFLFIFCTVF
jgi:hypothetical protein